MQRPSSKELSAGNKKASLLSGKKPLGRLLQVPRVIRPESSPEKFGKFDRGNNNHSPSSEDPNELARICKRTSSLSNIHKQRPSFISSERLLMLRKMVDEAMKEHKTFTVKGGYYGVRKALLERGWIEKLDCLGTNRPFWQLHATTMIQPEISPDHLGKLDGDNTNQSPNLNNKVVVQVCRRTSSHTDTDIPKPPRPSIISSDRLMELKRIVDDALQKHKTFTVKGGYYGIRRALLRRGWIEKLEYRVAVRPTQGQAPIFQPTLEDLCTNLPKKQDCESTATHIDKCEKTIMSRLLQHYDVDFYWHMRKDGTDWQHRHLRTQLINRFSRSIFTSKEGLSLLLQQMYWHNEPGVAFVQYPRCYTIAIADQFTSFIDDFRVTACIGFLKWLTINIQKRKEVGLRSPDGTVPVGAIKFALDRCNEYISIQKHLDIDKEIPRVWDHEWDEFLTHYYALVHGDAKFMETKLWSITILEASGRSLLQNMNRYWPQMEIDGFKNIWIVKPGNKCRGRGIQLIKDVNEVVKMMNNKAKYVVQKYIERPLIIYKTKFDIRQWFLVTSTQPLIIWMYRECYLRFSTQKFSLEDFHESVHLTNNAVQCKYTNSDRDRALPEDNMWDSRTFQAYLRQIGYGHKWSEVIYPGMKESIVGSMLASQETMDKRPNTFELFGADFMLSENFTPWLLEINSSPDMSHSTSVTARMCPQVLEDLIKVVIDKRKDFRADTGNFELAYKQNLTRLPAYLGMNLSVRGRRMLKKKRSAHQVKRECSLSDKPCTPPLILDDPIENCMTMKDYHGPVIGDLIDELRLKFSEKPGIKTTKDEDEKIEKMENDTTPASQEATKPLKQNVVPNGNVLQKNKSNSSISSHRKASTRRRNNGRKKKDTEFAKKKPKIHKCSSQLTEWKQAVQDSKSHCLDGSHLKIWEKTTTSVLRQKKLVKRDVCFTSPRCMTVFSRLFPQIHSESITQGNSSGNFVAVGLSIHGKKSESLGETMK